MKWINDNWSLIVVLICAVVCFLLYVRKFATLSAAEREKYVKAFLLAIVVEAEKQFGSGTGRVKLSWTYSRFVEAFPGMISFVSFELFSKWVDEVLEQMKNMLSDNSELQSYIDGEAVKLPFK